MGVCTPLDGWLRQLKSEQANESSNKNKEREEAEIDREREKSTVPAIKNSDAEIFHRNWSEGEQSKRDDKRENWRRNGERTKNKRIGENERRRKKQIKLH